MRGTAIAGLVLPLPGLHDVIGDGTGHECPKLVTGQAPAVQPSFQGLARICLTAPATFKSQTRGAVPGRAFFLAVSERFTHSIRILEAGVLAEIRLGTPGVSIHPPIIRGEADLT